MHSRMLFWVLRLFLCKVLRCLQPLPLTVTLGLPGYKQLHDTCQVLMQVRRLVCICPGLDQARAGAGGQAAADQGTEVCTQHPGQSPAGSTGLQAFNTSQDSTSAIDMTILSILSATPAVPCELWQCVHEQRRTSAGANPSCSV